MVNSSQPVYLGIATESGHLLPSRRRGASMSAEADSVPDVKTAEATQEAEIRERWEKLVEWLKSKHNMDVGSGGLFVEARKAKG